MTNNCLDCGIETTGTFVRCFSCNQKRKEGSVQQKFNPEAELTGTVEEVDMRKVTSSAPAEVKENVENATKIKTLEADSAERFDMKVSNFNTNHAVFAMQSHIVVLPGPSGNEVKYIGVIFYK